MKRRTSASAKRKEADVPNGADYGTAFVATRDGRRAPAPIGASQGIELTDVPDIDRPHKRVTVRVARRVDPILGILDIRKNDADRGRYLAAEQMRRDSAIADGAAGWNEQGSAGVSGGHGGLGPSAAMIDAQTAMRGVWRAVRGPENDAAMADVVRIVVLGFGTLALVASTKRCRHAAARDLLFRGLDRLVDHYGLMPISKSC